VQARAFPTSICSASTSIRRIQRSAGLIRTRNSRVATTSNVNESAKPPSLSTSRLEAWPS
jgi:hypothetical protein